MPTNILFQKIYKLIGDKQYTDAFILHGQYVRELLAPLDVAPIPDELIDKDILGLTRKLSEVLLSEPISLTLVSSFIEHVEKMHELLGLAPILYHCLHKNILDHFHTMAWVNLYNQNFDTALTYFIKAVELSIQYYCNADQLTDIGYNYCQFLSLLNTLVGCIAENRKNELQLSKHTFEQLITDLINQDKDGVRFNPNFKLAVNMPYAAANLFNLFYQRPNVSPPETNLATNKICATK